MTHEAGPELDRLIAEKVMGRTTFRASPAEPIQESISRPGRVGCSRSLPKYSTNIAHAWEVVEHLRGKGIGMTVGWWGDASWVASVGDDLHNGEVADTAPLAICRAALSALTR